MRRLFPVVFLVFVAACTDRSYTPTTPEALAVGKPYTVFAATTRAQESDGSFGFNRSDRIRLLELTVSIPPGHRPGQLEFGYSDPDPSRQFTMAGRREFADFAAFSTRLHQDMSRKSNSRNEVTLFVHGYNATQAETAFRAAQIANDLQVPGALMIYSWPSRGKALGYAYDNDSMLFARDGLERTMRAIKATGANLVVVAHSMGSLLTMEALRQIEISEPGWAARNLAGVVLIAPDLDVEVFRSQAERLKSLPQPFVIFVSQKDRALGASALLRGSADRARLGNSGSAEQISDLPVTVIDTTAFDSEAGSSHMVAVTSPALISMMTQARRVEKTFGRERLKFENPLLANSAVTGRATEVQLAPIED